jgi:hypothetical protein
MDDKSKLFIVITPLLKSIKESQDKQLLTDRQKSAATNDALKNQPK